MIRLVATDVDGTVVPEGTGTINPAYFDVIRKLHDKGIQVIIASGRPYSSILALFRPVAHLLWFIADGGSAIKTTGELEVVGQFPTQWAQEIWEDIHNIPGMEGMYCGKELVYAPDPTSEMYTRVRDVYRMNIRTMAGKYQLPEEPTAKISLYRSSDVLACAQKEFMPKWQDRIRIIPAGDWWVDCSMPNIHKGSALQLILDRHGYSRQELMASGDNSNDLEMVAMAEIGLAVSTAKDEVKAVATRVIPNFTEDGVLHEWQALLNV